MLVKGAITLNICTVLDLQLLSIWCWVNNGAQAQYKTYNNLGRNVVSWVVMLQMYVLDNNMRWFNDKNEHIHQSCAYTQKRNKLGNEKKW